MRKTSPASALIWSMLGACVSLAFPGSPRWTILGPGGGGAQFIPTISPHDPNWVLVACDMTGSYLTENGGKSWRMFNLAGRSFGFVFDPRDRNTIYVLGTGLWRSTDAGKTWHLIVPDPKTIVRIRMPDDHASLNFDTATGPAPRVRALAVDPEDSRVLYASWGSALHISRDYGVSWQRVRSLPEDAVEIHIDPRSPRQQRTLYVVGRRFLGLSRGGQWRDGKLPAGTEDFIDVSAGFPKAGGPLVIYGITGKGVFISEDVGQSWRSASPVPAVFQAIATSQWNADVAYVSYRNWEQGGKRWFGVAKTVDRGQHWELVWREADEPAPNIRDAWLTERFGPRWSGNPLDLGVAPNHPEICYATDYGRTLRTTDGGKTWHAVYSQRSSSGGWVSTGLDVTTCYGVHFDPFAPNRMFITYTDIGLFRSEDGGLSWVSSIDGVPRRWWNTTYWIEFDPQVRGRVWGVMSRVHDLPRPKMWRNQSPSTYEGGVCISEDGGRTWKVSSMGMDPTAATHILVDPTSPVEARVLYVAGFGRGVYKSVDGGRTWTLKNRGLEGQEPFAWRLVRDTTGTLYLIVARRSEDGSYNNPNDGALYRSTDGAETWTRLPLPAGVNGPNGLAVDPKDPKRLYLAVWGRRTPEGARDGGIFLSTDGGLSWRNVFDRDQHVYDVTIDPRNGVIYAAGFESSAWRSDDGGRTWRRIPGYNFKWGHRVIPDPRDPDKIFITTFGGSVWYGPAEGDPDAIEDIATRAVRPGFGLFASPR